MRRLVERLFDPASGLSRNRHFHTFDNDEGRLALRISKRLRALANDLSACRDEGSQPVVKRTEDAKGVVKVELTLQKLQSRRSTTLNEAEYQLLLKLPAAREALAGSA